MRPILAPSLLALALLPALAPDARAADAALVLAVEDYESLPDQSDADRPARSVAGLTALGFGVVAQANGDREETARALARFAAAVPQADRLVVALSGRFATDGSRTWLLTADSPEPGLFGLNANAVSVESVLKVLSRRPSRALLLLATEEGGEPFDPWIEEGIGAIEIPQGVTVLTGTPRAVAAFMAGPLSEPRGNLTAAVRAADGIEGAGYLPEGFRLMPAAPQDAPAPVQVPDRPTAAESALWQGAAALDTVEAYRNYLRVYPEGRFAGEARDAIAAILADPNRAARLEEDALRLTRAQRSTVQANLAVLDFDPRGIDGVFGPGTRAAIVNWQQQNGYPQTSYLDAEQVARLSEQARSAQAAEEEARRAAAAADDAYWRETGSGRSIEGLRAYLARYPEGRHAEAAEGRVAVLEAAVRAESAAWQAAREQDTAAAYSRYLEAHPQGRHAEEARQGRRAALAREAQARDEEREEARDAARAAEAALGLTPLTTRVIEARLRALDLDPGPVDGTLDGRSREAIASYQEDRGLARTGFLDEATLMRLVADTLGVRLGD